MPQEPCAEALPPSAIRGLELFNQGEYFEAHEALEHAWREERGSIRLLYQGILQVAVTYLHIRNGNFRGAVRLAKRTRLKLADLPETYRGVDLARLRADFEKVMQQVARLGPGHLDQFDPALFPPVHYVP